MRFISVLQPPAANNGRTLGAMLRRRAVVQPDDIAYRFAPGGDRSAALSLTFSRLDRRARAVAGHLGAAIAPGSRVMLALPQGSDFAGALFGCLLAGMVAVPVNARRDYEAVKEAVRACSPAVLLTEAHQAFEWKGREPDGVPVVEADGLSVGAQPAAWLAAGWRPVGVLPRSAAYVRYTAGKGAEAAFTQADVLAALSMLARASRLGLDEHHVSRLADVHGLAQVWWALMPVYEGRTAWTFVP